MLDVFDTTSHDIPTADAYLGKKSHVVPADTLQPCSSDHFAVSTGDTTVFVKNVATIAIDVGPQPDVAIVPVP